MKFYLSSTKTDDEVSNERVLSLAGSMADHDAPVVGLSQLASLDGLSDRADLVDLEEQAVASLLVDGASNALGVGDGQIVADELNGRVGVELGPRIPIVLVVGVLDRHDRVVLDHVLVDGGQLVGAHHQRWVRLLAFEVQVVLAVLVELASRYVHADFHLAGVAGLLDGCLEQLEALHVVLDRRGETALVSDVASV